MPDWITKEFDSGPGIVPETKVEFVPVDDVLQYFECLRRNWLEVVNIKERLDTANYFGGKAATASGEAAEESLEMVVNNVGDADNYWRDISEEDQLILWKAPTRRGHSKTFGSVFETWERKMLREFWGE